MFTFSFFRAVSGFGPTPFNSIQVDSPVDSWYILHVFVVGWALAARKDVSQTVFYLHDSIGMYWSDLLFILCSHGS